MELNKEIWLPYISKLFFCITFLIVILSLCIIFFEWIVKFYEKHNILFYALVFFVLALLCRLSAFSFESGDYINFLKPWFETFKSNRLEAIRTDVGDYTVIYKYFIFIATFFPSNSLYIYKFFSIIFDFLLAIYTGLFIYRITGTKYKALLSYAVVLFLPNIILNSGVWAQCDSIFSFYILLSCYYLYQKNDKKTIIYYTIAFCFKIQAIFFLPVIIISLLKKDIKFKSLLYFPLVYIIVILPAIICGMSPVYALFGAYLKQVTEYKAINLNSPNLFTLFSTDYSNSKINFLFIFLAIAVCSVIAFIFTNDKKSNPKKLILLSYLFTLIVPFTLPHMHERYFYLSDVFAIIFAFTFTKYYYISTITIFSSLPGLIKYLFGINENVNLVLMSYLLFTGIALLFKVVHKEITIEDNNSIE